MDLPKVCFCGCGEPRKPFDEANVQGIMLWTELARYVSYLAMMEEAGADADARANLADFLEDGGALYSVTYEAVHEGAGLDRKTRKMAKRWTKFSRKSREQINRDVPLPFDPFDTFASLEQVRTWVFDRDLPAVDGLPE